jgi:hypothetical protein
MSDEGRKKPPPRPPFPRPVAEPFRNLTEPSHVETAATVQGIAGKLDEVLASHRDILSRQRQMSLQLDGFGLAMNSRFDVFHEELAMLRATVLADHGPRIGKVETTLGQKAARGGGVVAIILLAGPMLADALPKYRGLIDAIVGAFQ